MNTAVETRKPAWVERVPVFLDGTPSTRLIFIFRAIGCSWAMRPDGGCTNCGFANMSTRGVPVADEDLKAQFDSVLDQPGSLDGVGEVDLYNSGSFLADQEIPPSVRDHVLSRLAVTDVQRVLIEARPEHVRVDKLERAQAALGAKQLEIGIGLESADDHVREVLVNKGFGKREFEQAVEAVARVGARVLSYVLIKPMGLEEQAAIQDAVATARYVFHVAKQAGAEARVAFQPVFVAPGTALEKAFLAGQYRPPSLWSVVEVVRRTHALGEILVGLSDEGLEPHMLPAGCERCTPTLRHALAAYNRARDLAVLQTLRCDCMPANVAL